MGWNNLGFVFDSRDKKGRGGWSVPSVNHCQLWSPAVRFFFLLLPLGWKDKNTSTSSTDGTFFMHFIFLLIRSHNYAYLTCDYTCVAELFAARRVALLLLVNDPVELI